MGGKRLIQKWKQREDQLIHIQMHTRANSLKLGHLVSQIIMKYYLSSTTFPKQSNTIGNWSIDPRNICISKPAQSVLFSFPDIS